MLQELSKQKQTVKNKGAQAYRDGKSIDACPYATIGEYSRRFRRIWIAGYVEARDGQEPVDK